MQRYTVRVRAITGFLVLPGSKPFWRYSSTIADKSHERLRILFCGSDQFSADSLRALAKDADSAGSDIESIDVVTRKDKRTGRGLHRIESPVIKQVAQELGLPLNQIDTFTGWSPPTYDETENAPSAINLIVAVSFGLLVPPRISRGATYGGLNVHPSLLPQFRGAAPLQWTILHGLKKTGVSLQTLHESKFDEGLVLDRVPVSIKNPETCTYVQLREQLGQVGAELLIKGIREARYMYHTSIPTSDMREESHAFKIKNRHISINPELHSAEQIVRMRRAFGKLWAYAYDWNGTEVRVTLGRVHAGEDQRLPTEATDIVSSIPVGVPYSVLPDSQDRYTTDQPLRLKTADGILIIDTLIVAGSPSGFATASSAKGGLLERYATVRDTSDRAYAIYKFCAPLRAEHGSLPAISQSIDGISTV